MRFRPCIDLHQGRVKQIVGSTLADLSPLSGEESSSPLPQTNFTSPHPPSYYARLYQSDGLTGGHVIMLGPGNEAAAAEALAGWPGGLQLGGGITPDNAKGWLDKGAAALIVTSYLFSGGRVCPERLEELRRLVGRERLVLDLSCRKCDGRYLVVSDRWQRFTETEISAESLEFFSGYCSELLIHAVDVEGKCAGVDSELISLLAAYSPLPTTYAGGVANMDDIRLVRRLGRGRIDLTVGSALDIFGGCGITYSELVAEHKSWGG